MNDRQRIAEGILDDLLNLDAGLSEWEVEFLESLARQRDGGKTFSEKQVEKLQQIQDRVI